MKPALILIGCGARKRKTRERAEDLYIGSLFNDRLAYAKASGGEWRILIAMHGLLHPDVLVNPYEFKLRDLSLIDQASWALAIAIELLSEHDDSTRPRSITVELHAGADYSETLRDVLIAAGVNVAWPVRGLQIGEQRAWYAKRRRTK